MSARQTRYLFDLLLVTTCEPTFNEYFFHSSIKAGLNCMALVLPHELVLPEDFFIARRAAMQSASKTKSA